MPGVVTYWLEGKPVQNMGDYLTELFLQRVRAPGPERYARIRLVGSVISDFVIRSELRAAGSAPDGRVAFWGCGQRDEYIIDAKLRAQCRFHGVRGPLTRNRLGLPENTVLGDPALLLPVLYPPATLQQVTGRTLCVPHFHDRSPDQKILTTTGADVLMRPNIPASMDALERMIDVICSARFVLAGALHAAIIACAYRVPFAYYIENYVDLPFKWLDFSASVNIPSVFARNVPEGWRAWQTLIAPPLQRPPLALILAEFPGPIRPGLLEQAKAWDLERGGV